MANIEESYPATVTANDDPDKRGRIRVACAGLMGDEDGELPMWIEPDYLWGWFLVPDVGEVVEIVTLAHSDLDESFAQASLEAPNMRWRGARTWTAPEHETPRTVPVDFTTTNYAKRRGFATPQGHVLLFDDTEGKEKVSITWHSKRNNVDAYSMFALDEDGSCIFANKNGSLLYLNAKDAQVVLIDEHGNSVTMDADGIRLIDNFSNIISMEDGVIQIISQGNVVVTGADFTAATGSYKLGNGAVEHAVLGESLLAWLNAHTHSTGMGPSGPPIAPAVPANFLSTVGLVE